MTAPGAADELDTLARQDAAADTGRLGVFVDGELVRILGRPADAWAVALRPGVEVLALCPLHLSASAVDCLDCEPVDHA